MSCWVSAVRALFPHPLLCFLFSHPFCGWWQHPCSPLHPTPQLILSTGSQPQAVPQVLLTWLISIIPSTTPGFVTPPKTSHFCSSSYQDLQLIILLHSTHLLKILEWMVEHVQNFLNFFLDFLCIWRENK